jgi:predicted DNA-binding protein
MAGPSFGDMAERNGVDRIAAMRYNTNTCDTWRILMPTSLRIPPKQEEAIAKAAKKAGKTKTAFILEAVNEKLGLVEDREQLVRKTAGWMSPDEATELRAAVQEFEEIHEEDWP